VAVGVEAITLPVLVALVVVVLDRNQALLAMEQQTPAAVVEALFTAVVVARLEMVGRVLSLFGMRAQLNAARAVR